MVAKARQNSGEQSGEIEVETPESPGAIKAQMGLIKTEAKDLLFSDTRAQSSFMDRGVDMAVGLLVVGLLVAYLLPIAIDEINAVSTSSWGSAESQLFGLLPIFFVLGILLYIVNRVT